MKNLNKQPVVCGEYSRLGYQVWMFKDCGRGTVFASQDALYTAGNSQYDSTLTFRPGTAGTLSLRQIRGSCIQTTRELAKDRKAKFGGVERSEDDQS